MEKIELLENQYIEIANELSITIKQVKIIIDLLNKDNTIPFIARYRKELTGNLNEEQIFVIKKRYDYEISLNEHKEKIIQNITNKGKMTDELKQQIINCKKISEVDNIYKPYVERKKTRAAEAIKLGLEPLAKYLLTLPKGSIEDELKKYNTIGIEKAIQGAKDIIAEIVADDIEIRGILKKSIFDYGFIKTKLKKQENDENKVYKIYYNFSTKIKKIFEYQVMAISRAEKEKVISVKYEFDKSFSIKQATWKYTKNYVSEATKLIVDSINDSFNRLLIPSVENEIWSELYHKAEEKCIDIFSKNVENILLQPPMKEKNVLAVDPAFRTGCKLALVSSNNDLILTSTIYQNEPFNKIDEAEIILEKILKENNVDIIAIGNGTASRETEIFINNFLKKNNIKIPHVIVSEAGASVYSASENARKEFPDLSVEKRSAISIARRVIDPLSELIKIDPKSIGTGQYQHDLPKKDLDKNLNFVVEKIVNRIGVDINTSSIDLLKRVSGLDSKSAKAIIDYRSDIGKINNREEIKIIPKITKKVFEQSSGFLRIKNGSNLLDETSIHPENYDIAKKIIKNFNINLLDDNSNLLISNDEIEIFSKKNNCSIELVNDIVKSIKQKRRDYRDDFRTPLLRHDVLEFKDLKIDMEVSGVVRNVVDFGAFVDIGIKDDALLHISNFKDKEDIYSVVSIGQILDLKIKSLDEDRKKVEVKFA